MNRSRWFVVGTALTLLGCGSDPEICVPQGPPKRTMEGANGTPGNNGLLATTFHERYSDLYFATTNPLFADPVKKTLRPEVTTFLSNESSAALFQYAIKCALPEGEQFTHNCQSFRGEGILTTTSQWSTQALDGAAADDLFTCIIAHLNPTGVEVPIYLSGPNVAIAPATKAYPVDEALWVVTGTEVGFFYDVWPIMPFPEMCQANPLDALKERVCGQDAMACELTPHDNLAGCNPVDPFVEGHYICNGKPAIKTSLQNAEFLPDMYPKCFPMAM